MRKSSFLFQLHFILLLFVVLGFIFFSGMDAQAADPFKEVNGLIVIEAENYHSKDNTSLRDWYIFPTTLATPKPDPDPPHEVGTGNGKYVEILPDTRVTHDDPFQPGVNFFETGPNAPRMNYRVLVSSAGRYYVRARAYRTGGEDNSVHFGYNNIWPTSGTALQWCDGYKSWAWSGARRTVEEHCGIVNELYLDLPAGEIILMVGMREDGVELDRFVLTKDKNYFPSSIGPAESPRTTGGTSPNNAAPTVNAGPDQTVRVGDTAALNGSASDDGIPDGTLTTQWKMVSGPGVANIANSASLKTSVSFSAAGNYVLELSAYDGALRSTDRIGFSVTERTANAAPVVNAGPDQTIRIGETATLNGTASDDGIPDGTLIIEWKMVSGPGYADIANSSSLKTSASFSATGDYVLELSAHDGALKTTDRVSVSVLDGDATGGVFNQDTGPDGLLVMDSEDHQANVGRGTHSWISISHDGVEAMKADPDKGTIIGSNYVSNSPCLRFNVNFQKVGTHYVWLRGFCAGNDNTAHVGLDGKAYATGTNITVPVKRAWVWSGTTGGGQRVTLNVSNTGLHTVEVYMREDGFILDKIMVTTSPGYVPTGEMVSDIPGGITQDGAFVQEGSSNGLVVMNAENHDVNADVNDHSWVEVSHEGIRAMEAMPDNGTRIASNYVSGSPSLRFNVDFQKTGTHYIWLRGYCLGSDNTAHAGFDGKAVASSENITLPVKKGWVWSGATGSGKRATISVNNVGLHTLEIYMREDGMILDKVLITTSAAYVPASEGPAESARK